ncbi:hypothetical protein C0583_00690 [Candidatus Parcubacteria bacterium]|nr:MAG: hypothetical protein C0583_00690 [Candidatus Parcubacteria bacterium]
MNDKLRVSLEVVKKGLSVQEGTKPITFNEFLERLALRPELLLRKASKYFADMFFSNIEASPDEYLGDSESINYIDYDMTKLFTGNSIVPFFPDRPFKNRLVRSMSFLESNSGQNVVFVFKGPPGCGKTTFINNLLKKTEEYSLSSEGERYEVVWRLKPESFGGYSDDFIYRAKKTGRIYGDFREEVLEIPCPSHCNPFLLISPEKRKDFLRNLLSANDFERISTNHSFRWLFQKSACSICGQFLKALNMKVGNMDEILGMIYVRSFVMSRKYGIGISVWNPEDKGESRELIENAEAQMLLNALLKNSNLVRLEYPRYSDTNNGVYVLMDVKEYNLKRFTDLHSILSEGYCKVGSREEEIDTVFIAVLNPENEVLEIREREPGSRSTFTDIMESHDEAFDDRKIEIPINSVLVYRTEMEILKEVYGKDVEKRFLPRVFESFAKYIVSCRLNNKSQAMQEWIENRDRYLDYCDADMLLLKMEIYDGHIPNWLSDEDRKSFNAKLRRRLVDESADEGIVNTISTRKSIKMFQQLLEENANTDKLVDMKFLIKFINKQARKVEEVNLNPPEGFLDSLLNLYDFSVIQELREAMHMRNQKEIEKIVKNYFYVLNFLDEELGTIPVEDRRVEKNPYTQEDCEIDESTLSRVDEVIRSGIGSIAITYRRIEDHRQFVSDMARSGNKIEETDIFQQTLRQYEKGLKEDILLPLEQNKNYRRAFIDWKTPSFESYDKKIKEDIKRIVTVLCRDFDYTEAGALQVCLYVIDKQLIERYKKK